MIQTLDESILKARTEAAEARCKRLEEALERIMDLKAGGPHISAEDGMSAALCTLDRARDIAFAALSDTAQPECCCENPPPPDGVAESSVYHCSEECPIHGDGR